MAVSYKPLFMTLVARDMKKSDLLKIMAPTTIAKLGKGEYIGLQKIEDICRLLNCRIEDVVEIVLDEQ